MPTDDEQQQLIDALKFTPRKISIQLTGYGGEIVIGRITPEQYEFWSQEENSEKLDEFVHDWDGEMDVPEHARMFDPGQYYDCDDHCHENGVELSDACWITVSEVESGDEIWQSTLSDLEDHGIDVECVEEFTRHDIPAGDCIFIGQSFEKGCFFEGQIEIQQPFDAKNLRVTYRDCDGWCLVTGVEYLGEEVEGYDGYSTNGKGSNYEVWKNHDETQSVTRAAEVIDQPEESKTQWYSADRYHPPRAGHYEIDHAVWPFPGKNFAEWDGSRWQQQGTEISPQKWRGLKNPVETQ